jgi:PAS domain S-box-containing protein
MVARTRLELKSAVTDDQTLIDMDDGRGLAQAIVDTIREPLLVLDKDLRVVTANRAFYRMFWMNRQDVQGRPVYALGDGQWNIHELRLLLGSIAPQDAAMEAFEVEREFSHIGRRTMLLNARKLFYEKHSHTTILLTIEDITERRTKERELEELLSQKDLLLVELQHRVANSLQIIASILMLKARTVRSEETRLHLQEAHQRIMSIATVEQQIRASEPSATIELSPYLSRLCEALAASMIGGDRPISLQVHVEGAAVSSKEAVSIGLIVTELVINALKHAFPADKSDCRVIVAYDFAEPNWRLTVSDNGIGRPQGHPEKTNPGLGMSIIDALARQLDAGVHVVMDPHGTTVSVTHATFKSRLSLGSVSPRDETSAIPIAGYGNVQEVKTTEVPA